VLAAVQDYEQQLINSGTSAEVARATTQFVAQEVRFIYSAGKALGQAGNGFSNSDYSNIMKSVQASNDYASFSQNLRNFAGERVQSVENDIDNAMSTSEIQGLLNDEKFAPYIMNELQSMTDRLDPALVEWISTKPNEADAQGVGNGNVDVGSTAPQVPSVQPTGNIPAEGAPPASDSPVMIGPDSAPITVSQELIDQTGGEIPQEALGKQITLNGNQWNYYNPQGR
jgi:hypothetical protein